jgi:hypothetical protein
MRSAIVTAGLLVLAWGGVAPTSAEAGFVTHTVAAATVPQDAVQWDSAPAGDSRHEEINRLVRLLFSQAFAEAPDDDGTSTPTRNPTSGPVVVAVMAQEFPRVDGRLIERLRRWDETWLPPAFLSGIFRPPRFAC